MTDKQIIIGITPGRSGSMSLAAFLDKQPGVSFTHEKIVLTHQASYGCYRPAIQALLDRPETIVGDINPGWLGYLDPLLDEFPSAKILFLAQYYERDIVDSFWEYKSQDKVLQALDELGQLWQIYPFDDAHMSKASIARTVGRYIRHMDNIYMTTPEQNIYVYTHTLDNPVIQQLILDWVGVPRNQQIFGMDRLNKRASVVEWAKLEATDPTRGVAPRTPRGDLRDVTDLPRT